MALINAIPMGQAVAAAGHLAAGDLTMPIVLVGSVTAPAAQTYAMQRTRRPDGEPRPGQRGGCRGSARIAQATPISTRTEQQASALEVRHPWRLGTTVRQTLTTPARPMRAGAQRSQVAVEGRSDVVGKVGGNHEEHQ
jgi:hypothetical protein